MDWFERLTGFRETNYQDTRRRLKVRDARLISSVNGKSWGIGRLELISLQELRDRVAASPRPAGRLKVSEIVADVRDLHRRAQHAGALFQVASQFNLLEMVGPSITPERGVGRYELDPTQGPACAISAGAGTIYRNYFTPLCDGDGQSATRQLDGLLEVGAWLSAQVDRPLGELWEMRNGYALCAADGLAAIEAIIEKGGDGAADEIRRRLRIGLHWDVEVTDNPESPGQLVSQAFCSALPVAYCRFSPGLWRSFATVILEAAYEATLLAGALNANRGVSNEVLLTRLGGGAFGNEATWIDAAVERALHFAADTGIHVQMVVR
jgi:hypothetical protein